MQNIIHLDQLDIVYVREIAILFHIYCWIFSVNELKPKNTQICTNSIEPILAQNEYGILVG